MCMAYTYEIHVAIVFTRAYKYSVPVHVRACISLIKEACQTMMYCGGKEVSDMIADDDYCDNNLITKSLGSGCSLQQQCNRPGTIN